MNAPTPQFQVPPTPTAQSSTTSGNKKKLLIVALAFFTTLSVVLAGLWGYSAWEEKQAAKRFDAQAESLAAQLEESASLASDLDARTDVAEGSVASLQLDALDSSVTETRETTDALNETVDEWLHSPYFIVETVGEQAGGAGTSNIGSSESGNSSAPGSRVIVTYDAAAVPKSKKTSSALKEMEAGESTLVEQTQSATEAVEELEQAVEELAGAKELEAVEETVVEVEEADEADDTSGCAPPVPGAYPCAGRGLPADAQPIQTVGELGAAAVTPSRNIGCSLHPASSAHDSFLMCLVESWDSSMDPNYSDDGGGAMGMDLKADGGPATFTQYGGVPGHLGVNPGIPAGQVMDYGNVYYYGDFVLASEENGLTVWSLVSGHGAFFNKDGLYPF